MKILFVHQNFPAQYRHLAMHLAARPGNQVIAISQRRDIDLPGIKNLVYKPQRGVTPKVHHYLRKTEADVLNAQAVARVALGLKQAGFVPDIMLGHNGWGEIWYLKDVFPQTPLLGYFEFFYHLSGADTGFDPEDRITADTAPRIRSKNIGNLLGLDAADAGQCPTQWQKSLYPARYDSMLRVVHEGIDTRLACPDDHVQLRLQKAGIDLSAGDEVVTYVARNLEPYRGFPNFMRSLPEVLRRRPNARVLIVGGNDVSYGASLPKGQSYRQKMLDELGDAIDLSRVHFLGKVPYPVFLKILQLSRVHVYLTYPFVLSWSMLEAMSAGCLIVGSRTAPVEEVIRDGENGLLVDFFSPKDISERVVAALEDPGAFSALRENARRTVVEKYDLETICLPQQVAMVEEVAGFPPSRE